MLALNSISSDSVASSGSSAITLVGAACAQAAASAVAAITVVQLLVGAPSAQSAASSAAAITQAQALGGAPTSGASASSTGAISAAQVLAGAGASQSAASSSGAISVAQTLSGAACTQAASCSSGMISVSNVVTRSLSPAWENLDDFLCIDDFAVVAIVTPSGQAPRRVNVIFDMPYMNAQLGEYEFDGSEDRILGKESDLSGIIRGDSIFVNNTQYWALTDTQQDGTGMAVIKMAKEGVDYA